MLDGIVVVLPTRNRADFAERSLASLVTSGLPVPLTVVVSDNSTDGEEAARLEAFCAQSLNVPEDVTVVYVRPESDLAMSAHWEWARRQAAALTTASHFLYLTDRSVFKPGALAWLAALAARYPDDVISYDADEIDDRATPVQLRQSMTTGTVVAVASMRLLYLSSQLIVVKPLPRMLNSLAPRDVLERAAAVYGTVFDSVAPDFSSCYRILTTVERVLYCDCPLFTMHGTARSNGMTTQNGVITQDSADFLRRAAESGGLVAGTAVPPVSTNYAIIAKEYVGVVDRAQGAFPALNHEALLRSLMLETEGFVPGVLREANLAVLTEQGLAVGRRAHLQRKLSQAADYLRVLGPVDFAVQSLSRVLSVRRVQLADTETAISWAAEHPRLAPGGALLLRYLRAEPVPGASYPGV